MKRHAANIKLARSLKYSANANFSPLALIFAHPPFPSLYRIFTLFPSFLPSLQSSLDLKGFIPKIITERVAVPGALYTSMDIQQYFIQIKPLTTYDVGGEDATMLAQVLFDSLKQLKGGDKREKAVTTFIQRTSAFQQTCSRYRWFAAFIVVIVANKLKSPSTCSASLANFGEVDAVKVASSFSSILASNSNAETGAVGEFLSTYPAMKQLSSELSIFRAFLTRIAKCLLKGAHSGAEGRPREPRSSSGSAVAPDVARNSS